MRNKTAWRHQLYDLEILWSHSFHERASFSLFLLNPQKYERKPLRLLQQNSNFEKSNHANSVLRRLPGKYFPTTRKMRLPARSEPWRRKNWRNSRSEKSSSGHRYWEQSCQSSASSSISTASDCDSSLCWFVRKGRASMPRSDANTKTEKSSDEGEEELVISISLSLFARASSSSDEEKVEPEPTVRVPNSTRARVKKDKGLFPFYILLFILFIFSEHQKIQRYCSNSSLLQPKKLLKSPWLLLEWRRMSDTIWTKPEMETQVCKQLLQYYFQWSPVSQPSVAIQIWCGQASRRLDPRGNRGWRSRLFRCLRILH